MLAICRIMGYTKFSNHLLRPERPKGRKGGKEVFLMGIFDRIRGKQPESAQVKVVADLNWAKDEVKWIFGELGAGRMNENDLEREIGQVAKALGQNPQTTAADAKTFAAEIQSQAKILAKEVEQKIKEATRRKEDLSARNELINNVETGVGQYATDYSTSMENLADIQDQIKDLERGL